MITVTGPDGAVHNFPDETSPDVIKGTMRQHYGAPKPPEEGFKQGPVEEQRSPAQSFTAGVGDAMLGGFGPQIAGFSEYTANLGAPGSYERGKQQYEERQGLEQRSNPVMHMGGEGVGMLTGAFGTPAAGPGLLKGIGLLMRGAGGLTRAAGIPAAVAAGTKGAMMAGPLGAYAAVPTFRTMTRAGRKLSSLGKALQESRTASYSMPKVRGAAERAAPTAEDIASARVGGMSGPEPTVSGGPSTATEGMAANLSQALREGRFRTEGAPTGRPGPAPNARMSGLTPEMQAKADAYQEALRRHALRSIEFPNQ